MPLFADYVTDLIGPTTFTGTGTASSVELQLSNQRTKQGVYVVTSAPSSLVGGAFGLQILIPSGANNTSGVWVNAPQYVVLLSSNGGTPQGVNANTTAATLNTGSVVINSTGISNLTDFGTFLLIGLADGVKYRLSYNATSGSVTFQAGSFGLLSVVG